jgi:hypothetical protein
MPPKANPQYALMLIIDLGFQAALAETGGCDAGRGPARWFTMMAGTGGIVVMRQIPQIVCPSTGRRESRYREQELPAAAVKPAGGARGAIGPRHAKLG